MVIDKIYELTTVLSSNGIVDVKGNNLTEYELMANAFLNNITRIGGAACSSMNMPDVNQEAQKGSKETRKM